MEMGTKSNPGEFDCYTNAEPDEPMFVLLGRDRFAPALVQLWADAREIDGETAEKVAEARECAQTMHHWLVAHQKTAVSLLMYLPFDALADELRHRGANVEPAPHGGDYGECSDGA
jgi:hypothetical protein